MKRGDGPPQEIKRSKIPADTIHSAQVELRHAINFDPQILEQDAEARTQGVKIGVVPRRKYRGYLAEASFGAACLWTGPSLIVDITTAVAS